MGSDETENVSPVPADQADGIAKLDACSYCEDLFWSRLFGGASLQDRDAPAEPNPQRAVLCATAEASSQPWNTDAGCAGAAGAAELREYPDAVPRFGALNPALLGRPLPPRRVDELSYFHAFRLAESQGSSEPEDEQQALVEFCEWLWTVAPKGRDTRRTAAEIVVELTQPGLEDESSRSASFVASTLLNDYVLARRLRILQWEALPRRVTHEGQMFLVSFESGTDLQGLNGRVSEQFQVKLARAAWSSLGATEEFLDEVEVQVRTGNKQFPALLQDSKRYSERSYADFIDTVGTAHTEDRKGKPGSPVDEAVLVEDGELTFFMILWYFRSAHRRGIGVSGWLDGNAPEMELNLDLRFGAATDTSDGAGGGFDVLPINQNGFLAMLGLSLSGSRPTQRWASFLDWLKRLREELTSIRLLDESKVLMNEACAAGLAPEQLDEILDKLTDDEAIGPQQLFDQYSKLLPLSRLSHLELRKPGGRDFRRWTFALAAFLRSDGLRDRLDRADGPAQFLTDSLRDPLFNGLATISTNAAPSDASNPHSDPLIERLCRPPYPPVEFFLRRYQPYEMHLLIAPLDWSKVRIGTTSVRVEPHTLAFTTIAGALPDGVARRFQRTHEALLDTAAPESRRAAAWYRPYWNLMSHISGHVSNDQLQTESHRQGGIEQQQVIGHEIGKLFTALTGEDQGWFLPLDECFDVPNDPPKPGRLGKLYGGPNLHQFGEIRIMPHADVYFAAAKFMSAYMGFGAGALPFSVGKLSSLSELYAKCRSAAFQAFKPFGVRRNLADLSRVQLFTELVDVVSTPNRWLKPVGDRDGSLLEWSDERVVLLAQAFMTLCREDVQHARPFTDVKMAYQIVDGNVTLEKQTVRYSKPEYFDSTEGEFLADLEDKASELWPKAENLARGAGGIAIDYSQALYALTQSLQGPVHQGWLARSELGEGSPVQDLLFRRIGGGAKVEMTDISHSVQAWFSLDAGR